MDKIIPVLTTGGICLKYDQLDRSKYKYIEKIKKIFTIEHHGFNHSILIARGYRVYKKHKMLVLPKFGFMEFLNDSDTKRIFHKLGIYGEDDFVKVNSTSMTHQTAERKINSAKYKWAGKPNSYQKLVLNIVMKDYFSPAKVKSGFAGVILNLPTGHGKTFVAMAIIDKIKRPTLFVCPTKKIAGQVRNILTKLFPRLKIGIYHSSARIDGDIIVGVVDSFANSSKFIFPANIKDPKFKKNMYTSKEFFKRWDLIIFDECHNYCTSKYSQIFYRISPKYTLGLSATPDQRQDSFDIICRWHIGPILRIKDIPNYLNVYGQENDSPNYIGKIIGIKYHGPDDYTKNYLNEQGSVIPYKMLEQLTSDPHRVMLIVYNIIDLFKKKYCVLIFADRISYLENIRNKLHTVTKLEQSDKSDGINTFMLNDLDVSVVQVTGGASNSDMAKAYKQANVIFTTYPFFKEGISISRINSIIYATPRKTGFEQTNGRCIRPSTAPTAKQRKLENNKTRIIIDIIDWEIRLKSQWYTRKKAHENMNKIGAEFEIEMKNVSFEDI